MAYDLAYDQEFFLDLAAKGKDAWNEWRRTPRPHVYVTFAGIDFSESPRDEIDFSGFEFGHSANFSGCKWPDTTVLVGAEAFAPGRACFAGASFGTEARFVGAAFGNRASFGGAAFGYGARFEGAAFGDYASFTGASFGDYARFEGAAFGDRADFVGATFGDEASFTGASFGDKARFDATVFRGRVKFTGRSKEQSSKDLEANADEKGKEARVALVERHKESWTNYSSGPDRFVTISLSRARFDGEAIFSGRTFERATDFTNARFYYPPDFDSTNNATRIDFTCADIGFARPGHLHWTRKTEVPVRLRAFRKITEDTKNHDLERDLFIEERKAERGVYLVQRFIDWVRDPKKKWALIAHILWIIVMGVYWVLAQNPRAPHAEGRSARGQI